MKKALETLSLVRDTSITNGIDILKVWAEEIIEEAAQYNWNDMDWEEKREKIRDIKWEL